MIDTIILTLPVHHFRITDGSPFQPNTRGLNTPPYIARVNGVRKCVQNPTKEDERNSIYKPRLTLLSRWDGTKDIISLKIEFSIPKLLFGNNFDELSDDNFPRVIRVLKEWLKDMWVIVRDGKLEQAIVSTIHYGKNIVLYDYTSVSRVLGLIAKTNISARFDTTKTDYQNGWEAFRLHTKSFQIILYDKIADLRKTENRGVDKDMKGINYQMNLFEDIRKNENQQNKKSFDVLRIEVRFMNKVKLKSIYTDLGIAFADPFTFQDAFCMETARRIVEQHWNLMMIDLKILEFMEIKSVDRWNIMMRSAKKYTPTKLLALAQLAELLSNDDYRDIRKQFEVQYNPRTLKRLYSELKEFQGTTNTFTFIPIIHEALSLYKPLQISEYKYTGVNNSK